MFASDVAAAEVPVAAPVAAVVEMADVASDVVAAEVVVASDAAVVGAAVASDAVVVIAVALSASPDHSGPAQLRRSVGTMLRGLIQALHPPHRNKAPHKAR